MKTYLALILLTSILNDVTMAQKLKENDKAPEFEMNSVNGQIIRLSDYENKAVLLTFFRFVGCPVCNMRVHELMENYEYLKTKNIEVIAVFESKNETLEKYVEDFNITFPVISDRNLKIYNLYSANKKSIFRMINTMFKRIPKENMKKGEDLYDGKKYEQDGSMTRIPADFYIINGSIAIAHYGRYIGDHIPLISLENK